MNNSITNPNNAIAKVAPAPDDLVVCRLDAKRYPRLYTYKREEAVYHMSKIVAKAFLYRGQSADPTNIQFISSALVDELMEDAKYGARNISFTEIAHIVKKAVLSGAEMYGISVASLYKVIIDWVKTEGTRLQKEAEQKSIYRPTINYKAYDAMVAEMTNKTKIK